MYIKLCYIFTSIICILHVINISCSNILIINHISLSSHNILYSSILEELIPRGHNVTYLCVVPYNGRFKSQVNQHLMHSDAVVKGTPALIEMMKNSLDGSKSLSPLEMTKTYLRVYAEEPCAYLENDVVTNIMTSDTKYDVIILHAYVSDCFHSIGFVKKAPVILISPSLTPPWHYLTFGVDNYFGIEKQFFLNYPQDNFLQRTIDFILGNYVMLYHNWLYASRIENWLVEKYPDIKFPPFYELQRNVSLLMVNSIPAMGYSRSVPPAVVNIGGIHFRQPQKLSPQLDDFISKAGDNGFIYFSFGGIFHTSLMSKTLIETFLEAFRQLPQQVLIKWADNTTSFPSNVLALPWLPQQDILGDPRLRVFITQAGIFSMQEAAANAVPVICFPLFLDQFTNAGQVENLGYGIKLDIQTVTTALLVETIQKIIKENRFKNTAKKVASGIADTLNSPKELLVWWTEYVIRNGGTDHLRTARQGLSWFQQQQLDVLFLLTSALIIILLTFYFLVTRLYKFINRQFAPTVEKMKSS